MTSEQSHHRWGCKPKGYLGKGKFRQMEQKHKGLWLDHSWLPLFKYLLRICSWYSVNCLFICTFFPMLPVFFLWNYKSSLHVKQISPCLAYILQILSSFILWVYNHMCMSHLDIVAISNVLCNKIYQTFLYWS